MDVSSCHKRPRNALALPKQQQQQQQQQPKKAVRFDLFQNTSASTQFVLLAEEPQDTSWDTNNHKNARCEDDNAELQDTSTVLDRSLLWFSPEDLYDIRLREANVVKIRRFCDDYLQEVASLLGSAISTAGANKPTASPSSVPTIVPPPAAVEQHSDYLASSPARGLESQIMPCMRQRRKQVVTTFLKSQTSLSHYQRQEGGRSFPTDLRQRALSEHYQRLARPAQLVAQWLAAGDARVVVVEAAV